MPEEDPRVLLANAEKAAQGATRSLSFFGSRTEKWETAADLYMQAGNTFRKNKRNEEAGKAFEAAANIQKTNLNEPMDMANTLTEAYKVYRTSSPPDAARVLQQAIQHYTSTGNFRRAATHQQNLAELYEVNFDPADLKSALAAYNTAAEWFESDNAEALANKLYLKVGDLAALEGDYTTAIGKFEAVATSSVNNNLMKWSVKEYFLKAGICHLAVGDQIATRRALEHYKELDNSFAQQRECMLLTDLVQCQEDGEPDRFTEKLGQYDQLSRLDKWKTAILVRVKEGIAKQDEEEDFS